MKLKAVLAFLCVVSFQSLGFAGPSLHNDKIELLHYLKIEGTYKIQTTEVLPLNGNEASRSFDPINVFVLIYDSKSKSLVGSFTNEKTGNSLMVFENLETAYSEDKKSILLTGVGGGVLHGEVSLQIGIYDGKIAGKYVDGVSAGRKQFAGAHDSISDICI